MQMILSCWALEHENLSPNGWDIFLVPFLATRRALVPLANDPIKSGTLIWSFRHLEHQNLSIISEDIGQARMVQQFQRRNGTEYSCLRG